MVGLRGFNPKLSAWIDAAAREQGQGRQEFLQRAALAWASRVLHEPAPELTRRARRRYGNERADSERYQLDFEADARTFLARAAGQRCLDVSIAVWQGALDEAERVLGPRHVWESQRAHADSSSERSPTRQDS